MKEREKTPFFSWQKKERARQLLGLPPQTHTSIFFFSFFPGLLKRHPTFHTDRQRLSWSHASSQRERKKCVLLPEMFARELGRERETLAYTASLSWPCDIISPPFLNSPLKHGAVVHFGALAPLGSVRACVLDARVNFILPFHEDRSERTGKILVILGHLVERNKPGLHSILGIISWRGRERERAFKTFLGEEK